MNKLHLINTAIVATAGLLLSDVADAQTKAEPIQVTVGGYMTRVLKAQDRDNSLTQVDRNSFAVGSADAEIYFNIKAVVDNGLVAGGRVELEGATETDQIDESYMFLEHSDFGRLEVGSTDRAASKMVYGAPVAIPGYGTVDPTGAISVTVSPSGARTSGNLTKFAGAADDADGINIYSARYFGSKLGKGLQLGLSYAPDGCQDTSYASGSTTLACGGGFQSTADAGQVSKTYTLAANYSESFGAFDLGLFAALNQYSIESSSVGNLTTGTATVFKSDALRGYAAGATLTYNIGDGSSIQAGGAYKREEMGVTQTNDDRRNFYALGLRYVTDGVRPGSIGIGVDYAITKADQGNIAGTAVGGEDKYTWYSAGVTYQLAMGIMMFGGIGYYEFEDAINAGALVAGTTQRDNNTKATFGIVGVRLDF